MKLHNSRECLYTANEQLKTKFLNVFYNSIKDMKTLQDTSHGFCLRFRQ